MNSVYLDGEYILSNELVFGADLFSLNYAVCAFEGIRSYGTGKGAAIYRLKEHITRYIDTCHFLKFESEFLSTSCIIDAVAELVRRNEEENVYLRPIAFIGEGIMGLEHHPKVRSAIFSLKHSSPDNTPIIKVGLCDYVRAIDTISKKISKNYFDSYMGLKEKSKEVDDLLFLDKNEMVTETSAHNIFFLTQEGSVVTPKTSNCLPGITRASVMTLLRAQGIEVKERDIHKDELIFFLASFTTSTASEIRIIGELDQVTYDSDNSIIKDLISSFRQTTIGQNASYRKWNYYV